MESGGAIIECDTSKLCALGCGSASRSQNAALTAICRNVHTPIIWISNKIGVDIVKAAKSIFYDMKKYLSDQQTDSREVRHHTFAGSLYFPKSNC